MITTGGAWGRGGGGSLYIATCDVEMTNINNYDTMTWEKCLDVGGPKKFLLLSFALINKFIRYSCVYNSIVSL